MSDRRRVLELHRYRTGIPARIGVGLNRYDGHRPIGCYVVIRRTCWSLLWARLRARSVSGNPKEPQ